MSLLLEPNAAISINVLFYDDQEKSDFQEWANATQINSVAGRKIQVPAAEFLAYFLIHRKGISPTRYPNLEAVKMAIQNGIDELEEWISYDGKTLHVREDVVSLENSFTEHIGEAAGLAVANRIHGLNEADWFKIPIIAGNNGRKTLDWGYASDGTNLIEVEAKGSVCQRMDRLAELSAHKTSIKAKKKDSEKKCHPRHNQDALRYGTITSISKDPNSLLTVRLVDPEGETYERTPHDTRVLKRLGWASWMIRMIASRTHLSVALQNRFAALVRAQNLGDFDKVALRGGTGEPISGKQFVERFFLSRTTSDEFKAAGALTGYDKDHFLFVGMACDWFLPVIRQRFDEITALDFKPSSSLTKVNCLLTPHRMDSEYPEFEQDEEFPKSNFVRFKREAVLHQSAAGLVFGLVPKNT